MKLNAFKQLIREAVSEAIREEMPNIINETLSHYNKQALTENRTLSFTSNDISSNTIRSNQLDPNVRQQLAQKIGGMMGYSSLPTAQNSNLQVINKMDEATGERVNPYLAFIQDAANNMTPMDRSGLRNLDS
jgi:hypothetical protein